MISTDNQSFDEGVLAYKNGHFQLAIDLLQAAVKADQTNWNARFYLAMCLTRADQTRDAKFHFMSIRDVCPNAELRERAKTALAALNAASRQR